MDQALTPPGPRTARWQWLLFGGLLLAEFLVFDRLVSRHHAWVYPRWNDQVQYLTEAYTSYERLRADGLWAGIRESIRNPAAQGTLHDLAAVLIFSVFGPSRSAALSLNMLAFLGWQAATFAAWRRLTGRWSFAWLAAGLLLGLRTLTATDPGSPIDFRLDWLACCAVGTAVSLGLLHDGFRHRGWSAAFGLAVGVAITARFLTLVYFAAALAVLLLWLGGRLLRGPRAETGRRLLNLLLAAAVAAAVALPLLWTNREWVYNYYWIGHLSGPESALRSPNFGVARSIDFVFRESLSNHHLGGFFWSLGAVALAGLGGLTAWRRAGTAIPVPVSARLLPAAGLGLLLFLIPGAVLVLHAQKSPLVVSVLLPGLTTVLLALLAGLARQLPATRFHQRAFAVLALGICVASAWHFVTGYLRQPHSEVFVTGARKVNALADHFLAASRRSHLETPRIAVDQVTDSLDAQIMRVICYERRGVWVPFIMTLPTGIMEESPELLHQRLRESDFVLLTDAMPGEGHWPYDRQMRRLHPEMKAWADANLQAVESFPLFNRQMTLYQRREIK